MASDAAMMPVLLPLAAAAALAYAVLRHRPEGDALRSLVKTASVASLALAALGAGAPPAIAAGLALGALGDWFLSRPGSRAFLAGMAAFGAGHLAYAVQFQAWGGGWPPAAAATGFVALALSTELWLAPHAGALRWPVRGYIALIAVMALLAMTVSGRPVVVLGAALFVASDLLLAIERFTPKGRRIAGIGLAVWVLYWTGQALILTGSLPEPLSLGA